MPSENAVCETNSELDVAHMTEQAHSKQFQYGQASKPNGGSGGPPPEKI